MAESTICKTLRDGTITLSDLGGTNSYTVDFETGDLSADIPGRAVNVFLNRGAIGSTPCVRFGDDQTMSGTFTAQFRDATDAAVAALFDFVTKRGYFDSTWVSTLGASAEVKTVDITLTVAGLSLGDPADHTIKFEHCFISGSVAEGQPDTITINWTSYAVYPVTT